MLGRAGRQEEEKGLGSDGLGFPIHPVVFPKTEKPLKNRDLFFYFERQASPRPRAFLCHPLAEGEVTAPEE